MTTKKITPQQVNEALKNSSSGAPPSFRVGAKKTERPLNTVITAAGKTRTLIETSNYDEANPPASLAKKMSEQNSFGFSIVADRLRFRTGCYWSTVNGELSYSKMDVENFSPFKLKFQPLNSTQTEVSSDFFSPVFEEAVSIQPNNTSTFYANTEDPIHVFNILLAGGTYKEQQYSATVVENVFYEDHSFEISSPYSKREIDAFTSSTHTMYASVKPTYNFYIPEYEDIISQPDVPEPVLPNVYVMLTEMSKDKGEQKNEWYHKHITLYDQLRLESKSEMMRPPKERVKFDPNSLAVQYFDMYGRQFSNALSEERQAELSSKFSNLYYSHNNIERMREFNSRKELFPMFVDIEFSTDKMTEFTEVVKETGMGASIMNSVASKSLQLRRFSEQVKKSVQASSETINSNEVISTTSEILDENRRVFDVQEWFSSLLGDTSNPTGFFESNNSIFIGINDPEVEVTNDPKYDLYKSLMSIVFSSKVKELLRLRTRTYEEMMAGKKCHTETVFYRIEKRRGGPNGDVIQNFWLPNSNDISIHNFVDTQVKYGSRYTYTIFAYELVFGSKYYYTNVWTKGATGGMIVRTEPSLKIVEVPYYSYSNRLLDSPPVMPDVEIIPFKGVSDKIKINFSGNVGRYNLHPQIIEPSDLNINNLIREAQDRTPDEPIRYESDDHASEFQVYRMDTHPYKYSDFENRLRQTVDTDIDPLSENSATSASYVDDIAPNKKYWYTFRSVDNHGHISYPTPIYQVEVVDDHGAVFPVIKVVDFAPRTPKEPTKLMKRIMQIIPSYSHGILNEEKSNIQNLNSVTEIWDRDTLFLGVKDETLWGKKFKIRLTSRKTGRKIDINVVFEHEHLKIKPE